MSKISLSQWYRVVLGLVGILAAAPAVSGADSPYFSGVGPVGGTNFGWGDRNLKMTVTRLASPPEPIAVDCYWIYKDGPRHGLALANHGQISATSGTYEVNSTAERNNGATFGIIQGGGSSAGPVSAPGSKAARMAKPNQPGQPGSLAAPGRSPQAPNAAPANVGAPTGPYRGWLIVGYDKQGRIVGSYANLPEFQKLAPGAQRRASGLEGPAGLNQPAGRGGGGLKTGGL